MYFNTIEEYNNYYKTLINNDKFEEHKNNKKHSFLDPQGDNGSIYYTYKQFIIDVKFDIGEEDPETCISDSFEPFYKPPFYQILMNENEQKIKQIQYDRPLILLDYKNDIIKYKDEIIKYIDSLPSKQ